MWKKNVDCRALKSVTFKKTIIDKRSGSFEDRVMASIQTVPVF